VTGNPEFGASRGEPDRSTVGPAPYQSMNAVMRQRSGRRAAASRFLSWLRDAPLDQLRDPFPEASDMFEVVVTA